MAATPGTVVVVWHGYTHYISTSYLLCNVMERTHKSYAPLHLT
jgi:hypothetical protein